MEGRRDGPAKRVGPLDSVKVALWSFSRSAALPRTLHYKARFPLDLDVTSTRSLHQRKEVQEVRP
jgi:hypothetical protein